MKSGKVHIAMIVAVLAVALTVVASGMQTGRSQSQTSPASQVKSPVKSTVRITATGPSAFASAAESNAVLRNELSWTFGGKQQRGWYLYELLIRRSLETPGESDSVDFAAALAMWQKRMGLSPDGVLDENTLMAMIGQWQSNRLKDRTPAQPDQLMMSSSSEFYDPERLAELRQIERETYTAYKRMLAAAIADPTLKLAHTAPGELAPTEKYFKVISAFRSREYQEELRRKQPNAGSAGLAINSPHFTGRALDIYVGGDPVDTKDSNRLIQVNTPVYQWLVRNAERFGFRPYFYEPWHWEYVR